MIASFARNSTAHLQNGTLVNTNLPRFETGRFGQAVMVEEGTTNLLTAKQGSMETDLTGFVFRGTVDIIMLNSKQRICLGMKNLLYQTMAILASLSRRICKVNNHYPKGIVACR